MYLHQGWFPTVAYLIFWKDDSALRTLMGRFDSFMGYVGGRTNVRDRLGVKRTLPRVHPPFWNAGQWWQARC